jgi:hypothetical protein
LPPLPPRIATKDFLGPRESSVYLPVPDQTGEPLDTSDSGGKRARLPGNIEESVLSSPLFKRGWVLQEMVLSRRNIHFAEDQAFWQCHEKMVSEDGIIVYQKGKHEAEDFRFYGIEDMLSVSYDHSPYRNWWSWVELYTTRHLTQPGDKFPALAGMTSLFAKMVNDDTPISGLWMNNIHFDLLWYVEHPKKRPLTSAIPSWSWASLDTAIKASFHSPQLFHREYNLRLVTFDLQWSGTPLTSQIIKGELIVEGRMTMLQFAKRDNMGRYPLLLYPEASDDNNVILESECSLDEEPPIPGDNITCLHVCTSETSSKEVSYFLLLLEPIPQSLDRYRRRGVGHVQTKFGENYFDGTSLSMITLV